MNYAIKPGPETRSPAGLPELWVVVPTFNERDNVTVHRRLKATQAGISLEVAFLSMTILLVVPGKWCGPGAEGSPARLAQAMTAK